VNTFTLEEVRVSLTAFALTDQEPVDLVDRFFEETL
jgi:hypothetical protein